MVVVISSLLSACSSATPSERERALARIPAQAQLILAADGTALSTPTFKRVIDSLTPHVPAGLACVLEAATTGEALAVGVQINGGTTIVLVTRAFVDRCPALSQIGPRMYTATIGGGSPVADRSASVLASPTWERARPYLLREPITLAAELPDVRLVAVAQPDPLDAWLAVDATNAESVERAIKRMIDGWQNPRTIELAGKLALSRNGTQVAVQADGLTADDLIKILDDSLKIFEAPASGPTIASTFVCPAQGNGVISCHDGTNYKVTSVAELVTELAGVQSAPVIAGGDVIGIRLLGDPKRLLQRDDIILGLDSHRITESSHLAALAKHLAGHASIAVRREGVEAVLELGE